MKFICLKCGHKEDTNTLKSNCKCGGLWKLEYETPKLNFAEIDKGEWSIFRYRNFMAFNGNEWKDISLGEGITPIIKLDENVLLKMDFLMPTLSYKDRGAAVLISHCKSIGINKVVQDSSGNAGNSIAAYSAKAGIECEIFVPEATSPKKIAMIESHGAKCTIVPGSRDNCADVCRKKVEDEGVYYANHVYNPIFYQGTKTFIYETFEQLGKIPDNIFLPVGNGTIFLGVVIALEEFLENKIIEKMPKIYVVQSEKCSPILKSFENKNKQVDQVNVEPTLAEGIAIGKPARGEEILEYIYKYNMQVISAPEDKILSSRSELAKKGIYIEHTTAAIYGAYKEYIENNEVIGESLITLTGAGLKSDH